MRFLGQSPVAFFTPDDTKLFHDTGAYVLNNLGAGQSKSWSNPATGAQGRITVQQAFNDSSGRPCKRVGVYNEARGIQGESTMTLCMFPDRGWLAVTGVKPPPAS